MNKTRQVNTLTREVAIGVKREGLKQICDYRVVLSRGDGDRDFDEIISFPSPLTALELERWLSPWLKLKYRLLSIEAVEWRVFNPASGEYETLWHKGD